MVLQHRVAYMVIGARSPYRRGTNTGTMHQQLLHSATVIQRQKRNLIGEK